MATKPIAKQLFLSCKWPAQFADTILYALITEKYKPGAAIVDDDYEGLLNWARTHATTIYHLIGTSKMGDGKMAVFDRPKILGR